MGGGGGESFDFILHDFNNLQWIVSNERVLHTVVWSVFNSRGGKGEKEQERANNALLLLTKPFAAHRELFHSNVPRNGHVAWIDLIVRWRGN